MLNILFGLAGAGFGPGFREGYSLQFLSDVTDSLTYLHALRRMIQSLVTSNTSVLIEDVVHLLVVTLRLHNLGLGVDSPYDHVIKISPLAGVRGNSLTNLGSFLVKVYSFNIYLHRTRSCPAAPLSSSVYYHRFRDQRGCFGLVVIPRHGVGGPRAVSWKRLCMINTD